MISYKMFYKINLWHEYAKKMGSIEMKNESIFYKTAHTRYI